MRNISTITQQIRDCVNRSNLYDRYFKDHLDEWNILCVAMDTLEDSCLAIGYYEASGIGEEDGEKYLKLYGLLQAIILQQDSIRWLHKVLLGYDLKPSSDSAWTEIRYIRNLTIGHPIEKIEKKRRAGTKRCFISRVTIRTSGFELLVWNSREEQNEFKDVNFERMYKDYKSEVMENLENIAQGQIKRWGSLQTSSPK